MFRRVLIATAATLSLSAAAVPTAQAHPPLCKASNSHWRQAVRSKSLKINPLLYPGSVRCRSHGNSLLFYITGSGHRYTQTVRVTKGDKIKIYPVLPIRYPV